MGWMNLEIENPECDACGRVMVLAGFEDITGLPQYRCQTDNNVRVVTSRDPEWKGGDWMGDTTDDEQQMKEQTLIRALFNGANDHLTVKQLKEKYLA